MLHEDIRKLNPEGFARQSRAAELEGEIALLAAQINAATFRLIEMLREFDELSGWNGWPTAAHWLHWRCGYSLGAARERFRVARALPELPLIREAFRAGHLSFAQVRAISRIATPENEATLLMWAQHSTASQMERFARLYRRYGENAAAMGQHRDRSFSSWEEDDGMVSFRIRLPAEQAAVVLQAVEAAKASLEGHDREDDITPESLPSPWEDPPAHPDENVSAETRHARRADALVRVAESYLEPDGRPRSLAEKYQVHVHLDFRRDADGPVADPDAPALAEETIRRLGCEAGLVPVLHDGEEILSVGRKTRAVPPSIRRALRLRDRGCRFPGCTHTRHVDAHHVRHWADGGETKLSNLVELCSGHHRLLHEGGYGLRVTDDGALVFTRPDGERIPEVPRPLVLTGDPQAVCAAGQHRNDVSAETSGPGVSAETFRHHWDGKPPDYGAMVRLLDERAGSGG
ncbi:HNH endonuclease signature motif containing protein [Wenzhouxiangella sp. XN24]|uniref:HNH endonuclease signature motif containing protein n=1 Tax=Wenzhouxiangella sp. XN24 TaxID=2713569 RepID=UPI0013EE23A4|nr:HNH endonuclease signature motif containing protein [Wenzhouxiangella sp. XN24]NGX16039.1 DUF222 domain-containing protein [Wenzhouxiangella sp. XN24]